MKPTLSPERHRGARWRDWALQNVGRPLIARLQRLFGRPTGLAGALAGWVMAHRSSNRRRNAWVVSLLDVRSRDRVLEVGFGPGLAIQYLSRLAHEGVVCGIDHSPVMLRQARRRNAAAVRSGGVDLRLASAERLPTFDEPFDKIVSVNAIGFWDAPVKRLTELRRLLRPGGKIAIAVQPRSPRASDATSRRRGAEIAAQLAAAGFSQIRQETLALRPAVVCLIAVNEVAGSPAQRDLA
jgi:SAM-dependent methyltransferase